jgi:DNA mismatch repair protein MutS
MAGMPNSLLKRAEELLIQLEAGRENQGLGEGAPSPKTATEGVPQLQLSIFDAHSDTFREIRLLLESTNIDQLTPVEALLKLQEIKNKLQ